MFILIATLIFSILPANHSKADTGQNYFDLLMIPKGETKEHVFPFKQGETYIVSVLDIQPQEKYTHSVKCTFRNSHIEVVDEYYSPHFEWQVFYAASDANETISCKNAETSRSNAAVVVRMTPLSIATSLDSKDFAIQKDSFVIKKFKVRKNLLIGLAAKNSGCSLYDGKGKGFDVLRGEVLDKGALSSMFFAKASTDYFVVCYDASRTNPSELIRLEFFDTSQSGDTPRKNLTISPDSIKNFRFSIKKQQAITLSISTTQMNSTDAANVKFNLYDKNGNYIHVATPRDRIEPDKIQLSFIPPSTGYFFLELWNADDKNAKINFSGFSQLKELKSSRIPPIN